MAARVALFVARAVCAGIIAAATLVGIGLIGAAVDDEPAPGFNYILPAPDADAAPSRTTQRRLLRRKARGVARRWCRTEGRRTAPLIVAGRARPVGVRYQRCARSGLVRASCWWSFRSRRGECAGRIVLSVKPPWHGHPGFRMEVVRLCYDTIQVWQRKHTRILDVRRERDVECFDDLDGSLKS